MHESMIRLYIRLLKEDYHVMEYMVVQDVLRVVVHKPGWDPPREIWVLNKLIAPWG